MTLGVSTLDNQPLVERAVADLGGRRTSRLREKFLVDGKRRDEHAIQFFNPVWIEKLGSPAECAEEPVEREVRVPASRHCSLAERGQLASAMAAGERIYLRPFASGDGRHVAELSLRETEVVFPEGRWVVNADAVDRYNQMITRADLPDQVGLAIVLRESDELIGVMAVFSIDWVHRTAETASEILRPEYRGGGYGTEAKHLLLEFAFDQLGLHMVYSSVSESNPRSAAALRKQGYRFAGYTAWTSFVASGLCGNWALDMLASEWRDARDRNQRGNA